MYDSPVPPEEDTTLDLRDYFRVLRRRKWIIIVTVLVCLGASMALTLTQDPVYVAHAAVYRPTRFVDQVFDPTSQQSDTTKDRELNNEIQLMNTPKIRQSVADKLGYEPEPTSIGGREGTDFIDIAVEGGDAKRSAASANAFAAEYIEVHRQLSVKNLQDAANVVTDQIKILDDQLAAIAADQAVNPFAAHGPNNRIVDQREQDQLDFLAQRDSFQEQLHNYQLGIQLAQTDGTEIATEAGVPTEPKNENPITNIIAGLAIGLVLGIALAFLREYLDDRIKARDDLETASGQTVIGLVPQLADWKSRDTTQLVAVQQPRSPAAEAYRSVRTSVEFLSLDQPLGSLQVTSAMAGEGKTTTLANLAVTFARVGQRVIVLCCDLRRPRVHEFFGLSNRVGFTSMLLGEAPASEAIQPVQGSLPIGLVASGPLAPNPAELLASKRAVTVIEELDSQCDLLLIDSPPVLPVTDAQVISGLVDGVLLVSSSGTSTKRDVRRAVELLHQVDAPLIGAILNNVHSKHESVYMYGDNRYYIDGAAEVPEESGNGRSGRRSSAKRESRSAR